MMVWWKIFGEPPLCTTPIGFATVTHDVAVQNSRILIGAAAEAAVSRIVHISITNPSEDSPLPYFRGKALVEKAIHESGLSYAILRPTVLFSPEDVLINNIAWFLRRFPAFPIAGSGDYPIQPVFVDDLAQLAVNAGAGSEDVVLDAVGRLCTFEAHANVHLCSRPHSPSRHGRRLASIPPPLPWDGLILGKRHTLANVA